MWFRRWWMARVRAIQWGPKPFRPYHITFTPRFAFSIPWFGNNARLRGSFHHGLQVVEWNRSGRWIVSKQLLGRSRVKGELYKPE